MNINWESTNLDAKIIYPNIFVNLLQGYWSTTKFARSQMALLLPFLTLAHIAHLLPLKGCSLQCVPHCSPFSQSIYNHQRDENYFWGDFSSAEAEFTQSLAPQYFSVCGQAVIIPVLQDTRL